MIEEFDDAKNPQAHDNFVQWGLDHKAGFFISIRSPTDMMLHRVGCWHVYRKDGTPFYDGKTTGNLAKNPKICSLATRELKDWAKDKGIELRECAHCSPQ